ncbi:MAG: hypothetical protein E7248_19165 [Paenibacillaceae bacterium]|jgi:hypothetical protein|nr:hypothetical protein [Paenibacillaceae bacterium]
MPGARFLFYNRNYIFATQFKGYKGIGKEWKWKKEDKKGGAGEMWVSPASYEKKFYKTSLE